MAGCCSRCPSGQQVSYSSFRERAVRRQTKLPVGRPSAHDILKRHREVWARKRILREVYGDWYRRIVEQFLKPHGRVLELGGGSGNFKEYCPSIISSDVVFCDWLDVILDAQEFPVRDAILDAIVLADVLHHIERPLKFFHEAVRTIRPGGRIIILDVYISTLSYLVFKLVHPERVDFSQYLWSEGSPEDNDGDPWDANQAVATKMFWREVNKFQTRFPQLRILKREVFSYLMYPLSGGFEFPSLMPNWSVRPLRHIERVLAPLGRFLSFRCLVVLEKNDPSKIASPPP